MGDGTDSPQDPDIQPVNSYTEHVLRERGFLGQPCALYAGYRHDDGTIPLIITTTMNMSSQSGSFLDTHEIFCSDRGHVLGKFRAMSMIESQAVLSLRTMTAAARMARFEATISLHIYHNPMTIPSISHISSLLCHFVAEASLAFKIPDPGAARTARRT